MKLCSCCLLLMALTSCALSQDLVVSMTEAHWSGDTLFTSQYPPILTDKDSIAMPAAINRQNPDFPDSARSHLINGKVVVKIWVDKTGKPLRATVLESTNPIFNKPALAAAMKWTFAPSKRNNVPIEIALRIPFTFQTKTKN